MDTRCALQISVPPEMLAEQVAVFQPLVIRLDEHFDKDLAYARMVLSYVLALADLRRTVKTNRVSPFRKEFLSKAEASA